VEQVGEPDGRKQQKRGLRSLPALALSRYWLRTNVSSRLNTRNLRAQVSAQNERSLQA